MPVTSRRAPGYPQFLSGLATNQPAYSALPSVQTVLNLLNRGDQLAMLAL